jgi:hypothetical protein
MRWCTACLVAEGYGRGGCLEAAFRRTDELLPFQLAVPFGWFILFHSGLGASDLHHLQIAKCIRKGRDSCHARNGVFSRCIKHIRTACPEQLARMRPRHETWHESKPRELRLLGMVGISSELRSGGCTTFPAFPRPVPCGPLSKPSIATSCRHPCTLPVTAVGILLTPDRFDLTH